MDEVVARIWTDLGGRVDGPFSFRVILQPLMATVFAITAGIRDARQGNPPYFWCIATDSAERRDLLLQGWRAIAYIFAVAVAIDVVYQVKVFGSVYPFELLLVGIILACLPYLVVRGLVTRLMTLVPRKVGP